MTQVRGIWYLILFLSQRLALVVFAVSALVLMGASAMALAGKWDWINLPVSYGGAPVDKAGMYAQLALTALALMLCFFLPSNRRVMQLENSHRSFSIGMNDVARAYAAVHAADRAATFQLSSEFDAVRERLAYLRDHPDLSTLEPALLEVAAQMSHISRELATVYADEKVERARAFLKQRQQEVEAFNARLDHAKGITTDLKHWLHEVELEESVAAAQLDRLRGELREVLPELGIEKTMRNRGPAQDTTVIDMSPKAAE